MNMSFSRFAVIGSNSFAGSGFISKTLENEVQVIGFNRSEEGADIFLPYKKSPHENNYKFYKADINRDLDSVIEILNSFQPEVVVDFAGQGMVAESWDNPSHWYMTNIVAKVKLHDYLRKCSWLKKYIRISTPEVYGTHEEKLCETWKLNPSTPYAVSHAAIDMSLRVFNSHYGFPIVFTRFANFYGEGQQLYRIIPRTIIYAMINKKLLLHGGGSAIRAFIYIDDVAHGIMKVIDRGVLGEVYHFSPEKFYTIKEIVEVICKKLHINFNDLVELVPDRPGKDKAYLMDSKKAREELEWIDSVSLDQGIDRTIQWVKENIDRILTLPLEYIHKA